MKMDEINRDLIECRRCPRLVAWRERVAVEKRKAYLDQVYWGRPVPGFGDPQARVFVVGLAPGAHGSNRTGRQFTGDGSGDFLFPALHRAGFASQPVSVSRQDGMVLTDLYTAPICRCVPPENKPTSQEMDNCQPYLEAEIRLLQPRIFVLLGRIAFDRLKPLIGAASSMDFSHGALFQIPPSEILDKPSWMVCSYHPSRQNTQTGRLTVPMFDQIWTLVRSLQEKA